MDTIHHSQESMAAGTQADGPIVCAVKERECWVGLSMCTCNSSLTEVEVEDIQSNLAKPAIQGSSRFD